VGVGRAVTSVGPLGFWGGGVGGGLSRRESSCMPLPIPPAEVGFIRLRPVNTWPNSGKPEFGCKRGRERHRVRGVTKENALSSAQKERPQDDAMTISAHTHPWPAHGLTPLPSYAYSAR